MIDLEWRPGLNCCWWHTGTAPKTPAVWLWMSEQQSCGWYGCI